MKKKSRNDGFLIDLIELLEHHGPKPFLDLIEAFTDPIKRENIVSFLNELSKLASTKIKHDTIPKDRNYKKQNETDKVNALIESIRCVDHLKADTLFQFYNDLKYRKIFSKKSDVFELCEKIKLQITFSNQRNKMLLPIIVNLSNFSLTDIKEVIQQAKIKTTSDGNDYKLLAAAIMKK